MNREPFRALQVVFVILIFVLAKEIGAFKCKGEKYNNTYQGCCKGKVYDKVKDGVSYSCCSRENEPSLIYRTHEETCCGNQVRNNSEIKGSICCEHHFRPLDKGLCCQGKYYKDGNSRHDACCGKKLNKGSIYECCDDEMYVKKERYKCCGKGYYNKRTHWCKKDRILKLGYNTCSGEEYQTDTHVCCYSIGEKRKKRTEKDDQCCDATPYNSKESFCKNGTVVSKDYRQDTYNCGGKTINKTKESCCDNTEPYDPVNQICCGAAVLENYERCCDGKRLDTGLYTCCSNDEREVQVLKAQTHHDACCIIRNGTTQTYNSNDNTCLSGKVVSNVPRCGYSVFNKTKDLCCRGVFKKDGKLQNLDCCGVGFFNNFTQLCNSGMIQNKTSLRSLENTKKCGLDAFNRTKDLCCSGVLFKDGRTLGKKCCGVTSYFPGNQTCCSGGYLQDRNKRFRYNPCTCPAYCQKSWVGNFHEWKILTKGKCGYKVFRLTKLHNKSWRIMKKKNKRTQKIVKFEQDCTCTCKGRKRLVLIAKRVTKTGKIRGPFYLLPNTSKFKKIIMQLKRAIKNSCRDTKPKEKQQRHMRRRKYVKI